MGHNFCGLSFCNIAEFENNWLYNKRKRQKVTKIALKLIDVNKISIMALIKKGRLCFAVSRNVFSSTTNFNLQRSCVRRIGSDSSDKKPDFISSTMLVEDGPSVRELPVVVRRATTLMQEESTDGTAVPESGQYHLIQAEFSQCTDLREVFSLLSKCIKITPNIALGAIERIFEIEKTTNFPLEVDTSVMNAHLAKGAILEKLLKVIMTTRDTQTFLNALNVQTVILEPYKYTFCDELLLRVIDNKLNLDQLSDFITFLGENRKDKRYEETIDKLWVGFVEKQDDINEKNIVKLLTVACNFKTSKTTVMLILEKKLWCFWWKLTVRDMQEILKVFSVKNNLSTQTLGIVGRWLNTNIHNIDEDYLLDFITKLIRFQYTDAQIESAIERYVKLKTKKIESKVLIVGILNYCMAFKIRNKNILNNCSKYFVSESKSISHSFLKSFIIPFGYLYHNPKNSEDFWRAVDVALHDKFSKICYNDLLEIVLSALYIGQNELKTIDLIFKPEFTNKIVNSDNKKLEHKLNLIASILSLENKLHDSQICFNKEIPALIKQDIRIKKVKDEIVESIRTVAKDQYTVSNSVSVPKLCEDELYIIDFLVHPESLAITSPDWITNYEKNKLIAILVHLPEHYCYNSNQLIGPQMLRKKHLRLLGVRVVSLSYALICKLQRNKEYFNEYIKNCIDNAEVFL